jgi:hypothetical protein
MKYEISQSGINGNYTIWLPEQDGWIEQLEEKHEGSQGYLWQVLILAVSQRDQIDLSAAYMEPEGDVFVAYAKDLSTVNRIGGIFTQLLEDKSYFLSALDFAETHALFD